MANLLRLLFLTAITLGSAAAARAQNAVEASNFGVRLSSGSRRVVELGATKSQVIQVLGPPPKTSRYYAETERAWATVLHYGSNKFDFTNDILDLVELSDARLNVGPGTKRLSRGLSATKTGDGTKTPLAFGHFLVENKPGRTRNLNYHAISYGQMKTAKGQVLDVAYEILYDQQGRVTHIFLDQSYD